MFVKVCLSGSMYRHRTSGDKMVRRRPHGVVTTCGLRSAVYTAGHSVVQHYFMSQACFHDMFKYTMALRCRLLRTDTNGREDNPCTRARTANSDETCTDVLAPQTGYVCGCDIGYIWDNNTATCKGATCLRLHFRLKAWLAYRRLSECEGSVS